MKDVLKKYLLYFISIMYLEFIFIILMHNNIKLENILNILLYSIIISAFLSIISNIFKKKINVVITSTILLIIGILFSVQCVFYNIFKVYFSLSNLGLGDQLASFAGETIVIIIANFGYILIFLIPFICYLIFHKKLSINRNNKKSYLTYLIIMIITIPIFYLNIISTKNVIHGTYELYYNVNEISLNINKMGVLNSYLIDFYRLVFGFKPKNIKYVQMDDANTKESTEKEIIYEPNILNLDLTKDTNNSNIKTLNNYIVNDNGTMKNEYTGLFKDYNLIYITAESFSEIGVSKELTPTLYKLTHSGLIFDNYYTPNALSTIGGEFQSLTGLYPDSAILPKWRSGNNYYPFGLATTFKNLGYNTYAYHNNTYTFQDRNKYLLSQGFDNYLGCYNGLEQRINCKKWPQSDIEMLDTTIPDYIDSDKPFLAYYMTVSGHFEYSFKDNAMASKNKNYVKDLDLSEAAKAYIATQIELDKALEHLLTELEKVNKLENTVIVLLADHYPYELDINSINSLSKYTRDEVVEVNHNALILWNSKMEDKHITKPCMSADVLPTVYNLFGIDYDSRLLAGRDILSSSFGIAIMRNRSWVTDKGTYFSKNSKFVGEEVSDEYIRNINNLVNNRLNQSKLIIETNYYDYLFKK